MDFNRLTEKSQEAIRQAQTTAINHGNQQVDDNMASSNLPDLTKAQMAAIEAVYNKSIRPLVHQRW